MSIEEAYLREIEDKPADRSVRLVYADWLDEHGDPRGELIRIEEQMRQLPFYAGPYWQLKPQRNRLREQADRQWLRRMGYGADHEPLCREVPQGWRERWRLLREFTERWYGLPMSDVGGHADEIAKVEAELGLQLPPAMREWIAFCSDLGDYFTDVLRDCYEVAERRELSVVSLMIAGEADVCWAVQKPNLAIADPPVDRYVLDYETDNFVHDREFTPRLTTFVFQHMVTYLSACAPGGDVDRLVFYEENASARQLLRYLTDVFLGADHALPEAY